MDLTPEQEALYRIADEALHRHTGKRLTSLEDAVLRATLQCERRPLTYARLAEKLDYSPQRITEVGAKLWGKLKDALGASEMTRSTVRSTLREIWQAQPVDVAEHQQEIVLPDIELSGYVRRSRIERKALTALVQPGGWFRMTGPEGMGKSTLLDQVLTELRRQDLQTATIDFTLMESRTFENLASFLKQFCLAVGRELDLPNAMGEYWDKDCDSLQNATAYFEKYLLSDRDSPVVLVLDDVDRVFEHNATRDEFCKLLVGWHRMSAAGRQKRRDRLWALLRVVVIHSTEVYRDWDINYSPLLGVGTVETVSDLPPTQVQQMAKSFGLSITKTELELLRGLIGGHPLLLRLAFEYVSDMESAVNQLVHVAATDGEPFGNHLRQKFGRLKQSPELWQGFRQVVGASDPVALSDSVPYRLERMGLVRFAQNEAEHNACVNRYELYRRYFLRQGIGM